MIDAHVGTVGVWLAFGASVAGVVVMAVGLITGRRDASGPLAAPSVDGRLLAPVLLVGALVATLAMRR